MAEILLTFEQLRVILKWYFKFENVCEVHRWWRREFKAKSQTQLTISSILDMFETDTRHLPPFLPAFSK
jgi:hypothetical protein